MAVIRVASYGRLRRVGATRCPEGSAGKSVWVSLIGRGMMGLHIGGGKGGKPERSSRRGREEGG